MDSSGTAMGMKQVQDPQPLLKCPRCDSSNTKFCYFNNYSLSQPRHFCKACKRYWTRGGTLRSVPVGGGCRKNKRMKRSKTPLDPTPGIPIIKSSSHTTNALTSSSIFYTQEPNNQSHINYPFQSFNSRIMNQISSCIGYDTGVSEAGFPSRNDLSAQQIHDIGDSHASLVNFQGFGSSSLQQQPSFGLKEVKLSSEYQGMFPFKDHVQDPCSITDQVTDTKEVKREEESELLSNKIDSDASCIDSLGGFDSLAFWNTVGAWPEISNYDSSVVSLI